MVAFGAPFQRAGLLSRWVLLRALWGQLVYLWIGADEKKLTKTRDAALKLTRGLGPAAGARHRAGDDRRGDRADRVRGGARADPAAPAPRADSSPSCRRHRSRWSSRCRSTSAPTSPSAPRRGSTPTVATAASSCATPTARRRPMRSASWPTARGIDLAASYAYSDSVTDLPMMELVGHPVAVNPDRPLLRIANEREWEVVRFVKPVRLRDRVPMPTPAQAAVGGGGAGALAAAAVFVWWRLRREPPAPPPSLAERIRLRAASWPRRRRDRSGAGGAAASSRAGG